MVRAGMLLVATPSLIDPNFAGTVVLLLDADDDGVLGVVLNRPSPVPVGEVLDGWSDALARPGVVFQGGPVSRDSALAVGWLREPDVTPPVGFQPIGGGLGLVDLETPPELIRDSLAVLRIYAGYAGWGADQLESEIAAGAWYVVPGEAADAFRDDADAMLREVLRRQPGELAWHATRPIDPVLN